MIAKQRGQIAADGLNREKWMESKITKVRFHYNFIINLA